MVGNMIIHGDCLEELKKLEDNSVDALVTDPPAGIAFMGKHWDSDKGGRDYWIKWMSEVMQECLRVLKPGAHGLVWSLPRTSHWTAMALEDAGFEIRDCITHLFGSGFPKSLDISKAIDKAAGAEREIIEYRLKNGDMRGNQNFGNHNQSNKKVECNISAPSTDAAKQWQGFGTALKPACERWLLVRKAGITGEIGAELWYTSASLGESLCRMLPAKFVKKIFTFNQNDSKDAPPDFVQWIVDVLNTEKLDEIFAKTDMCNSQEAVSTFLNIVSLWKDILVGLWENQSKFTIKMETDLIIELKILRFLLSKLTQAIITLDGIKPSGVNANASLVAEYSKESGAKLDYIRTHFAVVSAGSEASSSNQTLSASLAIEGVLSRAPFAETIWLIRKPLSEKTVAANVLKWGCGGLNIDGCRIESVRPASSFNQRDINGGNWNSAKPGCARVQVQSENLGRFPANLVLSHTEYCTDDQCDMECAVKMLNEQSIAGGMHSADRARSNERDTSGEGKGLFPMHGAGGHRIGDSGSASRFFYCAKASKSERNAGLEGMPDKILAMSGGAAAARGEFYNNGDSSYNKTKIVKNHHPTVKAQKLMRYLCKLITPPGGTILDPFMGSGSTGLAAKSEGFSFIGIEKEEEYLKIAEARLSV